MAETVINIYHLIDQMAPFETQLNFDNAGFLAGHAQQSVNRILVCLDITQETIEEAREMGAPIDCIPSPRDFSSCKIYNR